MLLYYLSKILSESLLSLYPIFIKKIQLPTNLQLVIRILIYICISLFFVQFKFIRNNIFKVSTLILGVINLLHIYCSYKGFELLDSGLSYTLFYTYPIFILLFTQTKLNLSVFISLLGVFFLTFKDFHKLNYYGLFMILIASITEALIYLYITKIKTNNSWNHLFLTYIYSLIIIILYIAFFDKKLIAPSKNKIYNKNIWLSIIINGIIGSVGYFLRFFSISNLTPFVYAILSYFGIFMSFIYGLIFNQEQITINKILGSILIFLGAKKEILF